MNPDYIPAEIGLPIAAALWTVLIAAWIRAARKARR